ncbi:MAG: hydantoinase/oxoprolinase family protein, partial [Firmicutes bacterium]|nr:hydantoinase/oxoprolinase family protein [Bacillota bacterium]
LIMRAIGRVAGLDESQIRRPNTVTKPVPIVPRERIHGITERVDSGGNVVVPLVEAEIEAALDELVNRHGVEAVAVSFLWSFLRPDHERRVAEIAAARHPRLHVTCSHVVAPVIREYARANTVIIDAFQAGTMREYIASLDRKLREHGLQGPLLLMQATGGVAHLEELEPVNTVSSGPAGGVIASQYLGQVMEHEHVITTDMGGTSFDVAVLTGGRFTYEREPILERFHVSVPRIDVESIGAGGGTIAWVEPVTGRLMVGPDSAGARPGPECYDLGGTEPTVTDMNLVMGLLDPSYFLGGRRELNRAKAEQAVEEKLARPLGMDVVGVAAGVYDIINAKMADLIRKKVVTTGYLPSQFQLYCFGGAGSLHAAGFSVRLGISKVYVFPVSSVFSAFGIAASDIVHTRRIFHRQALPADPADLNAMLARVEGQLVETMRREGFRGRDDILFRRVFQMRYRGQIKEIDVAVPSGDYTRENLEEIVNLFESQYESMFGQGSSYRKAGVEMISATVSAVGMTPKPLISAVEPGPADAEEAVKGRREAFFTLPSRGYREAVVYEFSRLRPGARMEGPAVIETPVTTIAVPPLVQACVDRFGNVELDLARLIKES